MLKRTVEISREPCSLVARDGQMLVLRRAETPRTLPARPANLAGTVPLEDIGVLMVDERETTYSHGLLTGIAEHGGALVVCGRDHHPVGMYVPISRNTELLTRLEAQLTASKPRKKRAWTAIVSAKIRAQSENLAHAPVIAARLRQMAASVRSGDPTNTEAQAARAYWPAMFDDLQTLEPPFRRRAGERGAPPPNNLLDYGYAVIRATVARSIVSAGLLPAIGIRHHNRSNAFCLADDLMEPLRPLVDARVRSLASQGRLTLDQPTKAELLRLLTLSLRIGDSTGPLGVVVVRYIASFIRHISGETEGLEIPMAIGVPGEPDEGAGRRDEGEDAEDENVCT